MRGAWGELRTSGSRGNALGGGVQGVSTHLPGGVWGEEPQNAKPKPLDHTQTETARSHPGFGQRLRCVARWDNSTLPTPLLRATSTVRCPLGQQHPTHLAPCNIHGALPVGTTAPYPNPYAIKTNHAFFVHPANPPGLYNFGNFGILGT
jgi:hypothetical protein